MSDRKIDVDDIDYRCSIVLVWGSYHTQGKGLLYMVNMFCWTNIVQYAAVMDRVVKQLCLVDFTSCLGQWEEIYWRQC